MAERGALGSRLQVREGAMGSWNPPGYYDEATLSALEQAFRDSWAVLSAHGLSPDSERDTELRTKLAEKLMALVAEGVINPHELRRLALESFPSRSWRRASYKPQGDS
jgi:hypothetical protein